MLSISWITAGWPAKSNRRVGRDRDVDSCKKRDFVVYGYEASECVWRQGLDFENSATPVTFQNP